MSRQGGVAGCAGAWHGTHAEGRAVGRATMTQQASNAAGAGNYSPRTLSLMPVSKIKGAPSQSATCPLMGVYVVFWKVSAVGGFAAMSQLKTPQTHSVPVELLKGNGRQDHSFP